MDCREYLRDFNMLIKRIIQMLLTKDILALNNGAMAKKIPECIYMTRSSILKTQITIKARNFHSNNQFLKNPQI